MVNALELKQSFRITNNMAQAIDILAMKDDEIDALIEKELLDNICLVPNPHYSAYDGVFESVLNQISSSIDFRQHLLTQLNVSSFNVIEKAIAYALIYNLDDDGILVESRDTFEYIIHEIGVFPEWIESVRLRLMDFDPLGCGALSINEALRHQARSYDATAFLLSLDKLAKNPHIKISYPELQRLYNCCDPRLGRMLNARPARAFIEPEHQSYEPDLLLNENEQLLSVSSLKRHSEKIYIDQFSTSKNTTMYKNHYARAQFLLKSLRYRENNLLKVASALVGFHKNWFLHGEPLRPLSLQKIAAATSLHESTISRLVKNKVLLSSRGMHELKYFFSQASNQNQPDRSSLSVKDFIKTLIRDEDKTIPMSDHNLSLRLKAANVEIARRTVTKYREALGILPARERRVPNASLGRAG